MVTIRKYYLIHTPCSKFLTVSPKKSLLVFLVGLYHQNMILTSSFSRNTRFLVEARKKEETTPCLICHAQFTKRSQELSSWRMCFSLNQTTDSNNKRNPLQNRPDWWHFSILRSNKKRTQRSCSGREVVDRKQPPAISEKMRSGQPQGQASWRSGFMFQSKHTAPTSQVGAWGCKATNPLQVSTQNSKASALS